VDLSLKEEVAMTPEAGEGLTVKQNWFWPDVRTLEGIGLAFKIAFWVAIMCSAFTTLIVLMSISNAAFSQLMQINAWAFLDVALWLLVAFGLWKKTPTGAWGALVLYLAETLWRVGNGPTVTTAQWVWFALFTLAFVNAVRASMSQNRMAKEAQAAPTAVQAGDSGPSA
jgi:hypothetical protein